MESKPDKARQAGALEAAAEVVRREMNNWEENGHGDYEGALELLVALFGSEDFLQVIPDAVKALDYYLARLREVS